MSGDRVVGDKCCEILLSPPISKWDGSRATEQASDSFRWFRMALGGGPRELRDQQAHKPFVALFQLREPPAETLDLAPFAEGKLLPV